MMKRISGRDVALHIDPHKEKVYVQGHITADAGGKTSFKCDTGETLEFKQEEARGFGPVHDDHLKGTQVPMNTMTTCERFSGSPVGRSSSLYANVRL